MSYIYWIDIENLFSWRSCASWFDIHRNGCASNEKNIRQHDYRLSWADLGDARIVRINASRSSFSKEQAVFDPCTSWWYECLRVNFFLFLYGLDCRCQCHVFFASEVLCHRSLSLSEPQVLSFAPFSKGLSTLNFVLGLPLGFFWDAQGCVDRVLSRTAWWWVPAFPPDSYRSLIVAQSCSSSLMAPTRLPL